MTNQTVDTLYQQALLADAAYLNWDELTTEQDIISALKLKRGFSETQAEDFYKRYLTINGIDFTGVIAHQENTSTGFAATLFKDKDSGETVLAIRGTEAQTPADLLTDLDLALITGTATFQYADLKNFLVANAS